MTAKGAEPRGDAAVPASDSAASARPIQPNDSGGHAAPNGAYQAAHDHDIVTTAEGSHRLETFIDFLRASGLIALLRSPGPFTVFAPTNRAFAKMSERHRDALLADRGRLIEVMRQHIVAGRIAAPSHNAPSVATPIEGDTLTVTSHGGTYRVNEARIVQTAIPASNGVIHAIDSVLMTL
jgi:uncharacterized surface protein with fasciclin (FAS1) repeats